MTIDVFGLTLIIAAIAGLIMIAGGIALLWKGAITLAATPGTTAISMEYRQMFKFSTQVPGIAFFAIGTILLLAAPLIAKTVFVAPVELTAVAPNVDTPVSVVVSRKWNLNTFSDGEINDVFYPDTSTLYLEVIASGYEPYSQPIDLTKGRKITLGSLKLVKRISKIEADPKNIAAIPFSAPSIAEKGSFGGAQ